MVRHWGGSVDGVYVISLQYSAGEEYQRGRRREGRGLGGEGGARAHWFRRNRRNPAMVPADSGVQSPQPGGCLVELKEGKRRGARGLFKGVVEASNYAGSKGIEEGRE
jgi:hypothetical protein